MKWIYGLSCACDITLYLACLGCLGILSHCSGRVALTPAALLIACVAGRRLRDKPRLCQRVWPTALAAAALYFLIPGAGGKLAALPPVIYAQLYVDNNPRPADHDAAADRFRAGLIVSAILAVVTLICGAKHWEDGLPYLFVYYTVSIALLRLLRHDDRVAGSRRFQIMNLLSVAAVCLVGFGAAQPWVLRALSSLWRFVRDRVLLPILAVLLYALQWALYLLGRLLSLLPFRLDGPMPDSPPPPMGEAAQEGLLARPAPVEPLSAAARAVLIALAVAAAAALLVVILRWLSRQEGRSADNRVSDERERLDPQALSPRIERARRGGGPEQSVRWYYRKAALWIKGRGGEVSETMNTRQIRDANAERFDREALGALREAYLPVRYGGRKATREDVRAARDAYERLKRG